MLPEIQYNFLARQRKDHFDRLAVQHAHAPYVSIRGDHYIYLVPSTQHLSGHHAFNLSNKPLQDGKQKQQPFAIQQRAIPEHLARTLYACAEY